MSKPAFARRYSRTMFLSAAALVITASGVGLSQDAAQDGDSQDQQQTRRLPNYYARVVTEDQRQEIYTIQEKHQPTIDELQQKLDEAIAAQDKEVEAVLNPEQLERVKQYEQEAQQRREARRGGRGRGGDGGGAGDGGN